MSYIDSFDHEFLGYFGHIPLYRPLAEVEGGLDDFDFGCRSDHIILGGGSGEHPAIIFSNPEFALAQFITSWLLASGTEKGERWNPWCDPIITLPYKDCVHFAGWSAEDYFSFGSHCRSAAMYHPFCKEDGALETWLASNIGELIFFAMQDLITDLEIKLPEARDVVQPVHNNIYMSPPGFPTYGRITAEGNIKWGHSRWNKK